MCDSEIRITALFNETLCYNEALKSPTDNTDS